MRGPLFIVLATVFRGYGASVQSMGKKTLPPVHNLLSLGRHRFHYTNIAITSIGQC